MKPTFTLLLLFSLFHLNAQNNQVDVWKNKLENFKIKPIIGLQLWTTYTIGAEVYNVDARQYEAVDNRVNSQLRRTRLGIKGQAYSNLYFNITTALDQVGKDLLAGTQGGANNGSSPSLGLWNAFLQWKIQKNKEWFNLTVGYLPPQIGRESITAGMRVTSMEKSWSQNYLRRQLVGTGPGRALGFNLGGLFYQEGKKIGFAYDLGFFNGTFHTFNGNSTGNKFAPLLVGRAVIYFGEPESTQYSLSHKVNYFGQRNGFSLAMSAARQGRTMLYKNHYVLGVDWLLNWKNLNFDGEWSFLNKTRDSEDEDSPLVSLIPSNTGYIRLSYNLSLANDRLLEPVLMMQQFNGALETEEQKAAAVVQAFSGKDYAYYFGLNYYLNPDLKFSLGFTWRQAESGASSEASTFNNYFFQSGVGAIHRGDWLGLGVVFIL